MMKMAKLAFKRTYKKKIKKKIKFWKEIAMFFFTSEYFNVKLMINIKSVK